MSHTLDTNVSYKFGHHCSQTTFLLRKSSVSIETEAETMQVNTETATRPQITHL